MSIPPLALTQERVTRLLAYIQTYRRFTLTQLTPSMERNDLQRQLQALQGKLIDGGEQQGILSHFFLTSEEIAALQTMVVDLRVLKAREPATEQRDATLVDLTTLKGTLDKLSLYRQQSSYTKTLL